MYIQVKVVMSKQQIILHIDHRVIELHHRIRMSEEYLNLSSNMLSLAVIRNLCPMSYSGGSK